MDSHKIPKLINNLPNLISIPILLCVYNYLLFKLIGYSFLIGIGVIVIFLIVNYYYRLQYSKYLKLHIKKSDLRMKTTIGVINNLKFMKLNGLDNLAINNITESRVEELHALELRYYITTISQTLLWFAPVAMSVASIGLYQYLNNGIIIQNIFTSLGIFTSLQSIIKNLPTSLDILFETLFSLKRIENFLALYEINDSIIEKYNSELMRQKIILQIENGYFTWDKEKNKMYSNIETKNLEFTQRKLNFYDKSKFFKRKYRRINERSNRKG